MISVLIVDDDVLAVEALKTYLGEYSQDIRICGTANHGERCLEMYEELRPDVVLVDLVLPGRSGASLIRELRRRDSEAKCVVLTAWIHLLGVQPLAESGAFGYLTKDTVNGEELLKAISAASRGEAYISQPAQRVVWREVSSPYAPTKALSMKETEVVRLVVAGLTDKEIAIRIGGSQRSIEGVVTSVKNKWGIQHRVEIATHAFQYGIVPPIVRESDYDAT